MFLPWLRGSGSLPAIIIAFLNNIVVKGNRGQLGNGGISLAIHCIDDHLVKPFIFKTVKGTLIAVSFGRAIFFGRDSKFNSVKLTNQRLTHQAQVTAGRPDLRPDPGNAIGVGNIVCIKVYGGITVDRYSIAGDRKIRFLWWVNHLSSAPRYLLGRKLYRHHQPNRLAVGSG